MDELFLYDKDEGLFKKILEKSTVMGGRYHVSPDYGHDLNRDNLSAFVNDKNFDIINPAQKYPIAVCITPKSKISKADGMKSEKYYFNLFFLTRDGVTGQNQVKSMNPETKTSDHPAWYDWKDMKECGAEFLSLLKKVLVTKEVDYNGVSVPLAALVDFEEDEVMISRLTKFNTAELSGVGITFTMNMASDGCVIADYEEGIEDEIELPDLIIHELHKH